MSSASDRLGNSRQFVFRRLKGCRKSAFFPPLWRTPERLGSVFSVGFPWQFQSPARQSGGSWRVGSSATSATSVLCPRTWPGRAGRAAPLPGPFSSPFPKRPIPALERQEGRARAARGGQPCPACRGPPSLCHPAHRHGNRCACTSKFPEAQPRVPKQGPARDPPAALTPESTFTRLVRRWAGARLGGDCLEEPLWLLLHPDTRVRDRRGVAVSWAAANGG